MNEKKSETGPPSPAIRTMAADEWFIALLKGTTPRMDIKPAVRSMSGFVPWTARFCGSVVLVALCAWCGCSIAVLCIFKTADLHVHAQHPEEIEWNHIWYLFLGGLGLCAENMGQHHLKANLLLPQGGPKLTWWVA